jgi:mRNA interferase MazF
MTDYPRRGEVWWVDFDPGIGGEIRKTRPAVVVSNNTANRVLNRVQVIPVTSNTERLYPAEAWVNVGGKRGKAMADQIFTASRLRFGRRLGRISSEEMAAVDRALVILLGLTPAITR